MSSEPDPLTRLQFVKSEIDRVFGCDFAREHPELTAAVMLSASLDFHALSLAHAVRDVAAALLVEEGVGPGAELIRPSAILR